jgi:hypothetical protein
LKPSDVRPDQLLYSPERFGGVTALAEKTKQLLTDRAAGREVNLAQLNRHLLQDAFPRELDFRDGVLALSDKGASLLASVGFFCFLVGRFTGAGILKKFAAHKVLGLYGVLNVLAAWWCFEARLSVACVFLSYFFHVTHSTIFALNSSASGCALPPTSSWRSWRRRAAAHGYVADSTTCRAASLSRSSASPSYSTASTGPASATRTPRLRPPGRLMH